MLAIRALQVSQTNQIQYLLVESNLIMPSKILSLSIISLKYTEKIIIQDSEEDSRDVNSSFSKSDADSSEAKDTGRNKDNTLIQELDVENKNTRVDSFLDQQFKKI